MASSKPFSFEIVARQGKARAGVIHTPHGTIATPSFVTVGTKATVKALTPAMIRDLGAQVVLANTYHLYLQPGPDIVKAHGGFAPMMQWHGPTMTDSGGFQVFSLGAAFGSGVSKIANDIDAAPRRSDEGKAPLAQIDEEGVTFKSVLDGSKHRFTPERSMEIQYDLGADIIFAFDECTSPMADYDYQKQALDRTHRWALRSLVRHNELDADKQQALFGVVQGGRFEDLRRESAKGLAEMVTEHGDTFDGFGIGGSFAKDDIATAVGWVTDELPEGKPRHLLGIGEPIDFFLGVEQGIDTFDCVAPTRIARNGNAYTAQGRINMFNSKFRTDMSPLQSDCACSTCTTYTRSYLAHLFHAKEMLAATLVSIHNLYFVNKLVADIRQSLIDGNFESFKKEFLDHYYGA